MNPDYYLVIKNGISEHFHKRFTCKTCDELYPKKRTEKCKGCSFAGRPDESRKETKA
jgi:hypothetical protein